MVQSTAATDGAGRGWSRCCPQSPPKLRSSLPPPHSTIAPARAEVCQSPALPHPPLPEPIA